MSNHGEQILFDSAPSPLPVRILQRRAMTSTPPTAPIPANPTNATMSIPVTPSSASTTLTTSTSTPTSTSLPLPFDQSLNNNVSASCDQFFDTFLADPAFKNCTPLSLLLQTSIAFFRAQRVPAQLNQILTASCSVPFPQCASLMSGLARQIQTPAACGADYAKQNPLVQRAYTGFITYEPVYHAGCLQRKSNSSSSTNSSSSSSSTGNNTSPYCFAEAATNPATYQDNYNYYLPLGVQLPPDVQPTCSQCSRDTMAIFAQAAGNASQPLSATYNPAARIVDAKCGSGFVRADVQVSSAAAGGAGGGGLVAMLAVAAVVWNLIV